MCSEYVLYLYQLYVQLYHSYHCYHSYPSYQSYHSYPSYQSYHREWLDSSQRCDSYITVLLFKIVIYIMHQTNKFLSKQTEALHL